MRVKALIKKWWAASTPLKRSEPLPDVQSYKPTELNTEDSFQTNSERLSTICRHHYLSRLLEYSFSQPNISCTSLRITQWRHAREWKYIFTNYKPWHWMEVRGQPQILPASPPEPTEQESQWDRECLGTFWKTEIYTYLAYPEYWTMILVLYIFS